MQLTSLVQSYHPTPLEHAYANYILSTHFSIAPPDFSLSATPAITASSYSRVINYEYDNIRLSGRNAAPFLSTAVGSGSGGGSMGGGTALGGENNGINHNHHSSNTNTMDRQFLKLAWHMVDPDEIGTLTSRKQFYVLLRLIAMAQAGFFPMEVVVQPSSASASVSVSSGERSIDHDVRIATILRIFEQDSHLAVPTPTFAADNEYLRPSVARLLEAYPPPPPPPPSITHSLLYSNVGGAGGYGTNNMLSPPPTNMMTMMSVHDAFDALIGEEAKDRPLPSLLSVMESVAESAAAAAAGGGGGDVGGGGDRSGGGDVPVENLEEVPEEENGNAESLNMEDEDDEVFGSFEDTTTTSSSVPPQTKHADLQGDFHDHAADYEDKFVTHNNVNDQQLLLSNETEYDDDDKDGNFGGDSERKEEGSADDIIANRDLQHNMDGIVVAADSVVHTDDDDVNDEINDGADKNQCDEEDNLDGFGDFEVVAPFTSPVVVDSPVQVEIGALEGDDYDCSASGTYTNMVALAAEAVEDDVSFSNFEDPDSLVRNQDEVGKKWEEISSCNDIVTSTTANNSDNKQYNLSSAFDGLIDIEDAPLPPLGSFYAAPMTGDESGFALSGHIDVLADNDGIAAAEENKFVSEVEEGNYFLNVSENVQEMTDEDGEVHYAKSDDGKLGKNGGDDATLNGVPSVFDAFGEALDAPLPSLGPIMPPPFPADNRDSYKAAGALGDEIIDGNDDFGDFEGVTEKYNLGDNNLTTIDDANANTINESSLFHPLANSNNMLLSWSDTNGVPSTVGVGNFDGLEENMPINRNSSSDSNHQSLEPCVDINGEAFHNGNHSQIMSTVANTLNGSDEFGVSGATPSLHVQTISTSAGEDIFCDVDGRVDAEDECEAKDDESFGQLESFRVVLKDDVHDVGEQIASLALVMNEHHNIEDQDFGRFDDIPEGEYHDGADELPEYVVSSPAIQESNDFFGGDSHRSVSVVAVDGNFNQLEAREVIFDDENNNGFNQLESHLPIDTTSGNAEVSALTGEAPSPSHSDVPDNDRMVEDIGNADDFDEGFGDFSSFEEAAAHQITDSKGDLETIIRSELGHEFGRLVGLWKRVISAIENDMQKGSKMIDSLANNQSAVDREIIIKSKKLHAYICGLAEFVRLVRSITASIGDLLCVANDIEVHETTLSQWNNDVMIADAIVIEYLWSRIASEAVALRIMSQVPHLESVVEIRNQFNFTATQKEDVCQLTLRPRVGGSCTQTPVLWNGKRYMACAANFCANRMPEMS